MTKRRVGKQHITAIVTVHEQRSAAPHLSDHEWSLSQEASTHGTTVSDL